MAALWNHTLPGIEIADWYNNPPPGKRRFLDACRGDLNVLYSRALGRASLALLSRELYARGDKVLIKGSAVHEPMEGADSYDKNEEVRGGNGTGSDIYYNPNDASGYTRSIKVQTPTFIMLAHELVHALHSITADVLYPTRDANNQVIHANNMIEEARTVGLGSYSNLQYTENAFRHAWNQPRRTYYFTAGDCNHL